MGCFTIVFTFAAISLVAGGSVDLNLNASITDAEPSDTLATSIGEKWKDADPTGAGESPDYIGGIDKGLTFMSGIGAEFSDPNLKNTAALLQSAGAIVSLIPDPPAAQAIGIGLHLVGGVMKAFVKDGPTTADLVKGLSDSLAAIDGKIDKISEKLDSVMAAERRLQATVDAMATYLKDIYEDVDLRRNQMKEIDDSYSAAIHLLQAALTDTGNPSLMTHFQDYVKQTRDKFESYNYGVMGTTNIKTFLEFSYKPGPVSSGGACSSALSYQSIVATRWKLHWMMHFGTLFQSGSSVLLTSYAEGLKQSMVDYSAIIASLSGVSDIINRRPEDLRKCLEVSHPYGVAQYALGLPNSTACPNNYQPVIGPRSSCMAIGVYGSLGYTVCYDAGGPGTAWAWLPHGGAGLPPTGSGNGLCIMATDHTMPSVGLSPYWNMDYKDAYPTQAQYNPALWSSGLQNPTPLCIKAMGGSGTVLV